MSGRRFGRLALRVLGWAALGVVALLAAAGEPGPYVLVGHSFGGFPVRIVAARWPSDVAGAVLVDASHEDLAARLPAEVRERAERQAGIFGVLPLMARLGVARVIGMPMGMVEKYPEELQPLGEAVGYRVQAFRAAADEGLSFAASGEQARAAAPFPDVPLVAISADAHRYEPQFVPPGLTHDELAAVLGPLQDALAALSPRGRRVHAEGSGHYVHLDRPELVVEAILEVVRSARASP